MKRLNLTVLTVFVLIVSLLISTIDCSAAEPYFTDLIEAELATQEAVDMYNFYLGSDIVKPYLEEINSYKYVIVSCSVDASASYLHFYCFNDDVVMYKYFAEMDVLGVISKSESIAYKRFSFSTRSGVTNPDGSLKVTFNNPFDGTYGNKITINDIEYHATPHYYGICGVGKLVRCDVPVYQDSNEAALALEGNDINPLYDNVKVDSAASQFTSEQIYLDDFQCIYHDAPSLDNCYIEFKYSIPKHLRNIKGNIYLDVTDVYKLNAKAFSGFTNAEREYFGMSLFSVSDNPYGFSVPVTNFSSVMQFVDADAPKVLSFVAKREVLGNEWLVDFDNVSIDGVGLNTLEKITKSQLFLDVQVRVGSKTLGKNGTKYSCNVDFLDLKNCYYESSSYDEVADTYKPNNDVIKDGYYSVDADNNYNYHSSDGKITNITSYDYDNSTNSTQYITNNYYGGGGNSNGSGEYISISPVDFNQFVKALKEMLDEFDIKGGLFMFLKDTFGFLPDKVNLIWCGSIAGMFIISVVCILRKH